jgi:16S rRNA G527 N7-methylase RsmG
MFHMKQLRSQYLSLLEAWNRKHNIIGRVSAEKLLLESEEALIGSQHLLPAHEGFIDIGAGSGIMGMAWLLCELSQKMPPLGQRRLVFVEPDTKSASFLLFLRSSLPELAKSSLLMDCRLEDVRRETITSFVPRFFCVARAFSPIEQLGGLKERSELRDDPFFVFFKEAGATQAKKCGLKIF